MNELQQCLQELDKIREGNYPHKQINYIKEHFEEAKPYLYDSLDKAKDLLELEDDEEFYLHNLYYYAIYLLAETKDKAAFSHIIDAFSLSDDAYQLYGDTITEDLQDILYETYDGNLELLKERIKNSDIDEFIRMSMLETYLQLYLDGTEPKDDTISFLKELVYQGDKDDDLKYHLSYFISKTHLIEMLNELKYLDKNDYIDPMDAGEYDNLVDRIFNYKYNESYCHVPVITYDRLKRWQSFSEDPQIKKENKEKEFNIDALGDYIEKEKQLPKIKKIGRNDPCPCGSGKKYKKCCMYKDADLNRIEDMTLRSKALEKYPKLRTSQDDRIYVNDYYDEESIDIDKIIYLALHRFSQYSDSLFFTHNSKGLDKNIKHQYLLVAFDKYVDKFNKENLSSNKEYDAKYSIHYDAKTWLKELLDGLNKNDIKYQEVEKYYNK
ncbi:MAG: DUF1186 domain-containing protein [Erysipelotrichaceae bacterium]|nr:DUF1186 domain-containing protein [Erysipelotrichaceae bacterium]